jgi:hypothetical protein
VSNYAINWAAQVRAPLSTREQFLLEVLADYANDKFEAWPSMETLARRTRMSRSTVYRLLARLEDFHHLIVKVQGGGNRGHSNRYRLQIGTRPQLPAELPEHGREIDDSGDPRVCHVDTPLYPQGVAPGDTGGVCHDDTPPLDGVSRDDTGGVSSDATGGVSSDATRSLKNPHEPLGAPEDRFALDERTKALGMARLAEMRARIGQREGCSGGAR